MKVTEIAFAEYPVTDLKRARQFYEGALGLKPARTFGNETEAWIEYDIGPGTLSITNMAPQWKPSSGGGSVVFQCGRQGGKASAVAQRSCVVYQWAAH